MDITNRCVKICRRLNEIEDTLACRDSLPNEEDELLYEKAELEAELAGLHPAT